VLLLVLALAILTALWLTPSPEQRIGAPVNSTADCAADATVL